MRVAWALPNAWPGGGRLAGCGLKRIALETIGPLSAASGSHGGLAVIRGRSTRRACALVIALSCVALRATPVCAYDWLQFDANAAHSGNNTAETILDAANVGSLTQKFQVTLPATVDGAPVLLQAVSTPSGVRDLLFVTTTAGTLLALDAHSGAQVWSQAYGANGCVDSNGSPCYTTSSPVLDPNRLYVYSYGLDGKVHKYQVGNGSEILSGGWPEVATLKGQNEKGSSALSTASAGGTVYLYVTHGGYPGDAGDYQGHVTAIDLSTGAQKVFHAACSDQTGQLTLNDPNCTSNRNAIWSRPGVIYDAGTNRIFVGTGNGTYNGNASGHDWSESVLALNADGSGVSSGPLDSFTPATYQSLDNNDSDLGSTAPAILPVPVQSKVAHLAVQGGKDQLLRLINLANLSGHSGPGYTGGEVQAAFGVPQGGEVLGQPAVWVNPADSSTWVFVANGNGISGFKLSVDAGGNPSLTWMWPPAGKPFPPGATTSPLVANNVLYYVGGGAVRALNPTTGATLWTGPGIGGTHWQSPIVANGVVYVTDGSAHLTAYALAGAAPVFTSASSTTFQVGVAGAFTVAATGVPAPTLSESGALPNGVTFTASSGALAGVPTVAGTFPLQFTASNGVAPGAGQDFALTVNGATGLAAHLTYTDAACTGFVISGTPPKQTVTCVGASAVPVCAPTASPAAPAAGTSTRISANCSNQPLPNGYTWTGAGACATDTSATCTISYSKAGTLSFTVAARNASGAGAAAPISVTWH